MRSSEDIKTLKYNIVTVTFQCHPRSKNMVHNKKLYACFYLKLYLHIMYNNNCFQRVDVFML